MHKARVNLPKQNEDTSVKCQAHEMNKFKMLKSAGSHSNWVLARKSLCILF